MKALLFYTFCLMILLLKFGVIQTLTVILPYATFWFVVAMGVWILAHGIINYIKGWRII